MQGDGNFKWWWGEGTDPEVFHIGGDTRADAIQCGKEGECDYGFTICEADKALPDFACLRADFAMDAFNDHNEECWGEDEPDWKKVPAGAFNELEQALGVTFKAWADKYKCAPLTWNFGEQRNTEYFPPADVEEALDASLEVPRSALNETSDEDLLADFRSSELKDTT